MHRLLVGLIASAMFLAGSSAVAQEPELDPLRGFATRAWLEELMERFELSAASPAYSARLRQRARDEAGRIRDRLEAGDFRVGDLVFVMVEGEETLSDTFAVDPGPELRLPTVGPIALSGVLRAELTTHLEERIRQFVRNPDVRVETLIRVSILGSVGTPGFYSFPSNQLLTQALMRAGLGGSANLDGVRVERGNRELWAGDDIQAAIVEGRTLDQLNLRGGDRIVVPAQDDAGGLGALGSLQSPLRALAILLALPAAILGLTRLF